VWHEDSSKTDLDVWDCTVGKTIVITFHLEYVQAHSLDQVCSTVFGRQSACCLQHAVMLSAETVGMRKCLLTLFPAKLK
jgi:hypothetical protein